MGEQSGGPPEVPSAVTFADLNDEMAFNGVLQQEDNVLPFISPIPVMDLAASTPVSSSAQMTVHQKKRLGYFVSLGMLLPKLLKQNNIASYMLLFTPNGLFSMYQLLRKQSQLWHSLPIHCSTVKRVYFITLISTARISQDFKKE